MASADYSQVLKELDNIQQFMRNADGTMATSPQQVINNIAQQNNFESTMGRYEQQIDEEYEQMLKQYGIKPENMTQRNSWLNDPKYSDGGHGGLG